MQGAGATAAATVLLTLSLFVAVVRPRRVAEALVALPAVAAVLALGLATPADAARTVARIGPTVGYLAAILALGELCAAAGVFAYLGALTSRAAGSGSTHLLALVVALAVAVSAVLTLDATVVLLTPTVLAAVRAAGASASPFAYACVRLANSSSLLLPVSNLTNLLAFSACGLSFGRFTALMLLPWLAVCLFEWGVVRIGFRDELAQRPHAVDVTPPDTPRYALGVLVAALAGFVLLPTFGLSPAWAAAGGCVALLGSPRTRSGFTAVRLLRSTRPGFCLFVLALAVLVDTLARHGLADAMRHLVPTGTSWAALVAMALLAAALANVVNNLPATLVLVPLAAGTPALALAMLLGVNIGPNATYVGSLATLLWRRIVPRPLRPPAARFHAIGLTSTPIALLIAVTLLWAGVHIVGA